MSSARHALSPPQSPNQLGGSVSVSPGEKKTIIQARGDDFDAIMVTVSVAPRDHPDNVVLDLVAHVQWGVGGTSEAVLVDVKRGFQLSVPLAGLKVDVENRAGVGTPTAHASAVVAYGTRPSGFKPTLTMFAGVVNAGATSPEITIPPRASTVQLLSIPRDYPLYLVQFRAISAGLITYEPGPASERDEMPIANNARFITVQNTSAARAELTLLFNLTI